MDRSRDAALAAAQRLGLVVIVILGALTAIEWFVGTGLDRNIVPLAIIAVVKAAMIVWYFMHVFRLWRGEEAH